MILFAVIFSSIYFFIKFFVEAFSGIFSSCRYVSVRYFPSNSFLTFLSMAHLLSFAFALPLSISITYFTYYLLMLARSRRTSPDASIRRLYLFRLGSSRIGSANSRVISTQDPGLGLGSSQLRSSCTMRRYKVRNIGRFRLILRYCVV